MAEAIANLGLSILLAHLIGVVGVAIGSAIPSVIVALCYVPLCLNGPRARAVGLLRRAWLLPTVACLPFLVATACFEHFLPARNLLMFFLQVILIVPLVPVTALFVCASRANDRT